MFIRLLRMSCRAGIYKDFEIDFSELYKIVKVTIIGGFIFLECKTKTELKYRLITQNRFLTPNSYFYGVYFLSGGAIISIFQTAGISKFA